MPWYNEEAETEYDLRSGKILEDAGWKEGKTQSAEKDGVNALR